MLEVTEDHLRIVKNVVWKLTKVRPIQDSEEYADGLMGLVELTQQFDPTKGSIYGWLSYKLRFYIIDRMRERNGRGAKRRLELQPLPDFENFKGYFNSEELENVDFIRTAISQLPNPARKMYELRSQGLTKKMIGDMLGCSESYVSLTTTRHEAQLREICVRLMNPPTPTEHLRASNEKPDDSPLFKNKRCKQCARA